ncbi:MAG: hypothetical protein JWN34_778 [Bryobacterales bacterium]|nr:hypothetical protein [Bryobacterales bacterium]
MLGTVQKWVDDTAYILLGGQRLLLRLSPRVGKSHLVKLLENELGGSAVLVDGAAFTKSSQASQREQIEAGLKDAIKVHGSAQLIFDSYDKAIATSQGARLQTWLSSRLIDSDYAQDVGALFTARCSTEVHRPGAGSPLMSRVTPIDPPLLEPEEAGHDELASMREWFGESALLAEQAHASKRFEPIPIADRFELDLSYIDDVRKASAVTIANGHLDRNRDSFAARCAAYGLLTEDGPTKLFNRLHAVLTASPADDPIWPDDWAASVAKFSVLVAGADEVIWSDRYMYRDVEPLRAFLKQVTTKVDCKIQLLGSDNISGMPVSRAELLRIATVPGVEARWMTQSDFRDLHDRHLVTGTGGWVLPQVHVIVGKQAPGSTVAAPAASFGVDYLAIWRRSIIP